MAFIKENYFASSIFGRHQIIGSKNIHFLIWDEKTCLGCYDKALVFVQKVSFWFMKIIPEIDLAPRTEQFSKKEKKLHSLTIELFWK